jgi:hypothetical protein
MAKKTKPTEASQAEETVRFTVDLPLSLHIQFTMLATLQRKSKAELIRTAIERLLKSAEQ